MCFFLPTKFFFLARLFPPNPINRHTYPEIFAECSKSLDLTLGGFNTVVLIASSLTMAMCVWSAQVGKKKLVTLCLTLTLLLGCVFLGVRAKEYHDKYVEHHIPGLSFEFEPGSDVATNAHAQLFFSLYFGMTGL